MSGFEWIPLLSPKPLSEFTPAEFQTHVRSLYHKPEPKRKEPVRTVLPKLTPKGNVSLLIRRKPQWVSREEITQAAKELGRLESEVWLYIAKKKIKVSDAKSEGEINFQLNSTP